MKSRRHGPSGAVLLEVLLAVGLLGLVAGCLLSTLHQARRIETQLRGDLEDLRATGLLNDLLTTDLRQARALQMTEPGALTIILRPAEVGLGGMREIPTLDYTWDIADSVLVRTLHAPGEPPFSLSLARGGVAEFEVLGPVVAPPEAEGQGDAPAAAPGPLDPVGGFQAKTVLLRLHPRGPELQGTPRELVIELPVAIPLLSEQGVRS